MIVVCSSYNTSRVRLFHLSKLGGREDSIYMLPSATHQFDLGSLVLIKNKFYLYQTIDIPDEEEKQQRIFSELTWVSRI